MTGPKLTEAEQARIDFEELTYLDRLDQQLEDMEYKELYEEQFDDFE